MNLVSALLSGIAGAANGWAEVYIRGSSTRATWFADFEASTSDSSGDNIDLDAYGAVEVYVNQFVDIVAKSPDGTVIRSWTDGYSAPNVEVISPAFTGHDYVSGAAAVNKPTTLQAVLDLWETNAGAPDWKVLIGGVATELPDAFGSLVGLVYNVKSPAYGAVGDGVANDQAAIQAALAAAVAAGGGIVFFPKGTYRISTAIGWQNSVAALGVGASQSVITTDSGTNASVFSFSSVYLGTSPTLIARLGLASTQANTGTQISCSVTVNLLISQCSLGASTTATGTLINLATTGSRLTLNDCKLSVNGASNTSVTWTSTSITPSIVNMTGCQITTTGTSYAGSLVKVTGKTSITSCEFSISSVTAPGTIYAIESLFSDDVLLATGNRFTTLAQTFTSYFKFTSGARVVAEGNETEPNLGSLYTTGGLATGSSLQLYGTRTVSASTTPTVPNATAVACMTSGLAAPAWTMPTGFYPGQELTVMMNNTSGGSWSTISFIGATTTGTGIPTINATTTGIVRFIWSDLVTPGTFVWRSVWIT